MKQTVKLPISVALAQKFVSEVFLTDKWDDLFKKENHPNVGDKPLPVMPRIASPFCPTEISWEDTEEVDEMKYKMVTFSAPQTREYVFVLMRGETVDNTVLWHPHNLRLDNILVHNMELARKHGQRIFKLALGITPKK